MADGHRLVGTVLVATALSLVALVGCGRGRPGTIERSDVDTGEEAGDAQIDDKAVDRAASRAVVVVAAACGAADPSIGSGLAITDDLVLTAGHVVASGGAVEIEVDDVRRPAAVVAFDPLRDLALIEPATPLDGIPAAPEGVRLAEGDRATIVGGATSGNVEATIELVTRIEMDEVRGQRRSTRLGYLVDASTDRGDSGAGLYDGAGRLAGLVFAVSTDDRDRTWVTAHAEIADFKADPAVRGTFGCDPDASRIARISPR